MRHKYVLYNEKKDKKFSFLLCSKGIRFTDGIDCPHFLRTLWAKQVFLNNNFVLIKISNRKLPNVLVGSSSKLSKNLKWYLKQAGSTQEDRFFFLNKSTQEKLESSERGTVGQRNLSLTTDISSAVLHGEHQSKGHQRSADGEYQQ